eukprot:6481183-Amphidinium_carterae.1
MATRTKERKIQQCSANDLEDMSQDNQDPRCVWLTCRPPGALHKKLNRASLSEPALIFDMVAELAIWQADLAI